MLTLDLCGGLDLLEINVVALVGLDAPADRRSLPGHLAVAAQGQVEDLGDLEHGVAEQLPVLLMVPALGHDLQVAPVEGHPDRAAFRQAVDPGLVDRPVDVGDDQTRRADEDSSFRPDGCKSVRLQGDPLLFSGVVPADSPLRTRSPRGAWVGLRRIPFLTNSLHHTISIMHLIKTGAEGAHGRTTQALPCSAPLLALRWD